MAIWVDMRALENDEQKEKKKRGTETGVSFNF